MLFDPVFEKYGLPTLVHLVEVVAGQSLAVGLSTWTHIMTLLYLQQSPTALRERHIDALRDGARQGVTAMAPGLKQLAGLGDMPLIADKSGDIAAMCLGVARSAIDVTVSDSRRRATASRYRHSGGFSRAARVHVDPGARLTRPRVPPTGDFVRQRSCQSSRRQRATATRATDKCLATLHSAQSGTR